MYILPTSESNLTQTVCEQVVPRASTLIRAVADSGGPWGARPLAPKIFFKSCSFQAILREKPLFWAQGPLLDQNSTGPPDQNPGSAPEVSC